MITDLSRRGRGAIDRTSHDQGRDSGTAGGSSVAPPGPLVEIVAYAADCILAGRVRLEGERLTDMLDESETVQLLEVRVDPLDGSASTELIELAVDRAELLLVHTAGPRGHSGRRRRTRQHAVAVTAGPYEVRGYVHALPGADPLTSIRGRRAMIPITDARIEFQVGSEHHRLPAGVVLINRDHIAFVSHARDVGADRPDMPVSEAQGVLLKDFTGNVSGGPTTS
jgi:hypothetical protein